MIYLSAYIWKEKRNEQCTIPISGRGASIDGLNKFIHRNIKNIGSLEKASNHYNMLFELHNTIESYTATYSS